MNEFAARHYDDDEVNRIIRQALKLRRAHGISYQDLIDTAMEIGLDLQTVETAIDQEQRATRKERIQKTWLRRRREGFCSHFWRYLKFMMFAHKGFQKSV